MRKRCQDLLQSRLIPSVITAAEDADDSRTKVKEAAMWLVVEASCELLKQRVQQGPRVELHRCHHVSARR